VVGVLKVYRFKEGMDSGDYGLMDSRILKMCEDISPWLAGPQAQR